MSADDSLHVELRDDRMPTFEPVRWGLRPSRGTVMVGVASALAAVACVALFSVRDLLVARAPDLSLDGGRGREAAPPRQEPPSEAQVGRAFDRVRDIFNARGAPALASEGAACFAALDRAPSYSQLDFCLAFDAFASGVAQAAGAGSADAATYFNEATVRHIRALDAVGASQREARARILAISALATAVGRARPAIVPPPPPPEELPLKDLESTPPPVTEEAPYTVIGPAATVAPDAPPELGNPQTPPVPTPPPVAPAPAPPPPRG